MWFISFMVCTFASGAGLLLAAILKPNAALIAGVILPATAGAMFSGLIAAVPNWLSYLSFIRFATEWFLIGELWTIDKATGFDPSDPNGLSLTSIFLFSEGLCVFLFCSVLAFFLLLFFSCCAHRYLSSVCSLRIERREEERVPPKLPRERRCIPSRVRGALSNWRRYGAARREQ